MSASAQAGDQAFSRMDFHGAIEYYTLALESPPPDEDLPLETKRAILSQRAQANIRAGAFYDAAFDCDHALSAAYTTDQSPKSSTSTLCLQRAYVKQILTYYEDAMHDFIRFEELQTELGQPKISKEANKVLQQIEKGMRLREDSGELKRVKLIRAVQARGLLLSPNYRQSFPRDPDKNHDDNEEDAGETSFESGTPGADYLREPVSVLFHFYAPYLEPPDGAPNSVRTALPEDAIIGDNVQDIFTYSSSGYVGDERAHEWEDTVSKHESTKESTLVLLTRRGRVLRLPWETKVRDIWRNARWPMDGPSPLEVLWSPPAWPHEVDGMEMLHGCLIPVYVVPNDRLAGFIERLAAHFDVVKARRRARFRDS